MQTVRPSACGFKEGRFRDCCYGQGAQHAQRSNEDENRRHRRWLLWEKLRLWRISLESSLKLGAALTQRPGRSFAH